MADKMESLPHLVIFFLTDSRETIILDKTNKSINSIAKRGFFFPHDWSGEDLVRHAESEADRQFLTTGEAARLCSVTPNTILRWVHAGRLKAATTSGGHHRISRSELVRFTALDKAPDSAVHAEKNYQYCWEFHGKDGVLPEGCLTCIVYRSRSGRCYQLAKMTTKLGHSHLHCTETCEECEYYREMQEKRPSVLVVTPHLELRDRIASSDDVDIRALRFVDCEYECCREIESFQPDYVVIDCSIGRDRCQALAKSLASDSRVPFVRLILVGKREQFPEGCDKVAFAFVRRSFNLKSLEQMISNL
jgi:excisionase family DNA binding protein